MDFHISQFSLRGFLVVCYDTRIQIVCRRHGSAFQKSMQWAFSMAGGGSLFVPALYVAPQQMGPLKAIEHMGWLMMSPCVCGGEDVIGKIMLDWCVFFYK